MSLQTGDDRPSARNLQKKRMSQLISPMNGLNAFAMPSPMAIGNPQMSLISPRGFGTADQATLLITDLDFFEQELAGYQESVAETLMNKRSESGLMNSDPIEELGEVYSEVQVIERDFKKTLGICQHLLGQSRSMFMKNEELNQELDKLKVEQ